MIKPSSLDTLERAIKEGDVVAARRYLDTGGDVHASDGHHRTPLSMAASAGHSPLIQLFLDAGADVNERWPDWSTPLCLAAMSGSAKAVALLLARGANSTVGGKPLSAFLRRTGYNDQEKILSLIDGAGPDSGRTSA